MPFQKGNKINLGKKHSEERVKKLILRNMGNKYNLGNHHSEETKKKMSLARKNNPTSLNTRFKKGHIISEEIRQKIGTNNKGKTHTPEIIKKIKELHGGVYHSEDTKRKISESQKKNIKNIEKLKNLRIKRPTKPQVKLFEFVKSKYSDSEVVMECTVKTREGLRFIDVAVPELKIGFEYDAPYWHQNKKKDQHRHELIEAEGWKLTHYSDISEF